MLNDLFNCNLLKKQSLISDDDIKYLEAYNSEIENGVSPMTAFYRTMQSASDYAVNLAQAANGVTVNLQQIPKASKIAVLGLKAVSVAGNMLATWAINKGIELAVKALYDYAHRLDNAKETLSNTQSELSFVNDELKDTADKIAELEALNPSSLSIIDKEDLQRLKEENEELKIRQKYLEDQEKYDLQKVADLSKEKYGRKYGNTDHDKVDEYRSLYADEDTKAAPASSYLTGGASSQSAPYAASQQNTGIMRGSGTLADLIAQYEYYTKLKNEAIANKDAEGIEQYNNKLAELAEKLRNSRTELQGFSDDLEAAGDTSAELDLIKWQQKVIDDLLLSPGQNLINFLDNDILSEDKQKLIELANAGKLTQNELSSSFSEVDKYIEANGLTLEDLISVLKLYKKNVSDGLEYNPLSISDTVDQLNTRLNPALSSLKSAYQSIFTDDGFTLENIDIDMLGQVKSAIDHLNSLEDINIDASAFENFARVLSDTSATSEEVQEQFSQLASTIVYASGCAEVNSDTFDILTQSLEKLGISNASEILEQTIQAQKDLQAISEKLGITLGDVTAATYEETVQMLANAQAENLNSQALWKLAVVQGTITDGTITTESNGHLCRFKAVDGRFDLCHVQYFSAQRRGMFLSGIYLIAGRFQHGKGLVAGHAVDDHVASLSERKHFIQSRNFRNSIVHVFADGLVFVRCGFCHALRNGRCGHSRYGRRR